MNIYPKTAKPVYDEVEIGGEELQDLLAAEILRKTGRKVRELVGVRHSLGSDGLAELTYTLEPESGK